MDINIKARQHNERYGDLNNLTVQQKYNNYKSWTTDNRPEQKILSFKEWIEWAIKQGLVPKKQFEDALAQEKNNFNAEGDNAISKEGQGVLNQRKIIAVAIVAALVITTGICIIINLNKNKT